MVALGLCRLWGEAGNAGYSLGSRCPPLQVVGHLGVRGWGSPMRWLPAGKCGHWPNLPKAYPIPAVSRRGAYITEFPRGPSGQVVESVVMVTQGHPSEVSSGGREVGGWMVQGRGEAELNAGSLWSNPFAQAIKQKHPFLLFTL